MTKKIKILLAILILSALAWAADVECPFHPAAVCYNTGEVSPNDVTVQKWHCSCGDDVWVRVNQ